MGHVRVNMALSHLVMCAVVFAMVAAEVAVIKTCDAVQASICNVTEARIDPCRDPKACVIKKGASASISFDFTPGFSASKLKAGLYWDNNAVDIPFSDMGSDDGCSYTECPIEAGKSQTLNYRLNVGKKYPKGTFTIKWKLWNEEDATQLCCFKTVIKLKNTY